MSCGRHRRPPRTTGGPPLPLYLTALLTGGCAAFTWIAATQGQFVAPATAATRVTIAPQDTAPGAPARIDIAKIGVSSDLESLVRRPDGAISTPGDWNRAGWYAEGVTPGQRGSAVIVGHRDSAAAGPAVFYRLGELTAGDEIAVTDRDGLVRRFVVVTSTPVSKAAFPSAEVYAPSSRPLLRLITCTGTFDAASGSYVDNLVVTARAV